MPVLPVARILYVNAAAAAGGDGTLATPYNTLVSAVNAAAAGDSIFVAAGLYDAGTVQIKINVANLTVIGGWKADGSEWSASNTAASRPSAPNTAVSGDRSKYMNGNAGTEPTQVVGNTTVLKLGANSANTTFSIYIPESGASLNYLHIYSPFWTSTGGALIKIATDEPDRIVPKNITLNYITFENQQVNGSTAYTRKCLDFNGVDGTAEAPNTVSNCYIPAGISYGMSLSSCHYVNVSNCVFATPNAAVAPTPVAVYATANTDFKIDASTPFNIKTEKIVFSNNTWPTYAQFESNNRGKATAEYPEPTIGTGSGNFDITLDSVLQYLLIGTGAANGFGGFFVTYATSSYSTYFTNAKNFIGTYLTSLGGAYNNDTAKASVLTGTLTNCDIKDIKSGNEWHVHTMTNFGGANAVSGSANLLTTVAGSRLTTPYAQSGDLIYYASGATIPAANTLPSGLATISAAGVVAGNNVTAAAAGATDATPAAKAVRDSVALAASKGKTVSLVAAGAAATPSTSGAGEAAPVVDALSQVSEAAAAVIVNNFITASEAPSKIAAFLSLKEAAKSAAPDADEDKKINDAMQASSLLTGATSNSNGKNIGNVAASVIFSTTYLQEVVAPPNPSWSTYVIFPTYTLNANGIYSATIDLSLEAARTYYIYVQSIGQQLIYTYDGVSHTVYKTSTALLLDGAAYTLGTEIPFGTTFNYTIYGRGNTPGGGEAVPVACFVEGTRIMSQNGYKPIEKFTNKDMLVTSDNRIINFKLYRTPVFKTDETNAPYVIEAHAFGRNMPAADLYLSARHMVQIRKGVWTCAEEAAKTNPLVKRAMLGKSVTYYHVECENYLKDNVIAEGMVAESYGTTKSYKGTKTPYTWNSKLDAYTRSGVPTMKNVSTA